MVNYTLYKQYTYRVLIKQEDYGIVGGISTEIAKELVGLRENLLDLTLRNGLLNHRISKRRTIEIIDESPREIYDILVLQEKAMHFLPTKKNTDKDDSGDIDSDPEETEFGGNRVWLGASSSNSSPRFARSSMRLMK